MSYQEIDPKDIRKGDHIRTEYDPPHSGVIAREIVSSISKCYSAPGQKYFLIHRPVTLPTEPGLYIDSRKYLWRLKDDSWDYLDFYDCEVDPTTYLPFHRLMTETEWEAGK